MQSNVQTDIPVTCSGAAAAAQGPSSGTPVSLEWTGQMNLIGGREQQVKRFTGSQAALDLA